MNFRIIFLAPLAFLMLTPLPRPAFAEMESPPALSFEPLSVPVTDAEKTAIRVSPGAATHCCVGKREEHALEYRVLLRGGMKDKNGHIAGLITGSDGLPLTQPGGSPFISARLGATSPVLAGGNYYFFTHFGEIPGAAYLSALDADKDGNLSAKEFAPVDFSGVRGTLMNRAGSNTPWGTHLASEQDHWLDAYWFTPGAEPYSLQHIARCAKTDTGALTGGFERAADEPDFSWWCGAINRMRGDYLKEPGAFSQYRYGFTLELAVDRGGAPSIKDGVKRLAMGRFTPGMALVMPDRRTVYLTDDGTYAGFFMFIADDRNDLSAGTLYIAKWRQQVGGAVIKWVPLGHGTDKKVAAILDLQPDLSDIFDVGDPLVCPAGFRIIKAGPTGANCLRLRDGKNGSVVSSKFGTQISPLTAAAFLEPRRYGAFLGGTTEWNSAKGLAYDSDHGALFMAVGGIGAGMLNNLDPVNDIRIPENVCGAVLRFKLGGANDTVGNRINSRFAATWAEQATAGVPLSPGQPYADENGCHPDFIAGLNSVQYIGRNILLAGEGGDLHFNNYAWAFDVERKTLTRIASAPTGAEIAGVFAPLDALGRFYIFVNVGHPLANAALNAEGTQVNGPLLNNAAGQQRNGSVGYISGLPGPVRTGKLPAVAE